jgi:hypothetical protein
VKVPSGAVLLALALPLAAAAPARTPTPKPPLDFSGTWELDERASLNVSPKMKGALLVVEQHGDRIRIAPGPQGPGKLNLAADEIVLDGRSYEKNVGGARGITSARWSADGQALELNITAEPTEKRGRAVQTVRWTLSRDRSTWVRETHTTYEGRQTTSRLVFRRQTKPPPAKKPSPPPAKK